jgi:flagellum-specific peptidoglycan hydrolase FlgJ
MVINKVQFSRCPKGPTVKAHQSMFVRKIKSRAAYINHLADSYATSSTYSEHLIQVISEVEHKF